MFLGAFVLHNVKSIEGKVFTVGPHGDAGLASRVRIRGSFLRCLCGMSRVLHVSEFSSFLPPPKNVLVGRLAMLKLQGCPM